MAGLTPPEYLADPGWKYLREPDDVRLANQSKPYDSKKNVWAPDKEEGYIAGEIKATKGDTVTIVTAKGSEVTIKKDDVQEMNPPKFDKAEDMSNLSFLNDASVLGNLRARYGAMLIYTYSGLFCVVINPYKRLPIYTDSVAKMYMGKRKNEMPPHLWANSDEAYRNMITDRENQSMLITGESGAGKTENTKKVIAYFAYVGASQQSGGAAAPADDGKKKVSLEDQIVQTNPILEAFGNAKTVRNNNSSRFGKFIRIHFSNSGKVAGCDIEHYLLEKSRVIRQAPGERCYHVFYFMYTDAELRKKLFFTEEIRYYHFVSQAELTVPGIDDTEEQALMDEAFDILQFTADEKFNCYRIMSAIMHMGEMKFKETKEQACPDEDQQEADYACKMYGIDTNEFLDSLCKPRVKVGTEWVTKGQNMEQVAWGIGAMSKGIYARVFDWLVTKCNQTLDAKEHPRAHFIGVLDIAGFEIFDFNSFEQLWINFVNEKLQQFFNHHMFVLEQEEYQREGIQWTFIDFGLDLAACIELIEKPMGIISMLDEECIVPKATDMTLAQKLVDQHLGKHPNFIKPPPPKGKQAEAHFAMKHYAGTVRYNVSNWLEKNKDPLNDTTVSVMKKPGGTNALVAHLWSSYQTQEEAAEAAKSGGGGKKKGKSGSMMTVSMMYRESLNKLMTMLHQTHPHFVRCIIPNELKKSGLIDSALVMNQLTCNGVLEGIRICRKGFPNRMQHIDFKIRYSILAPEQAREEDMREAVEGILKKLCKQGDMDSEEFRVGHTKVFFKAGILAKMEDLRDAKLGASICGIQTFARWGIASRDYLHKKRAHDAYGVVQKNIKSWSILRTWDWYLIYGKIRPLLGKAQEEIDKMEKRIVEIQGLLVEEEGKMKEAETEQGRLTEIAGHIEEELRKRRENEHHAADMAAAAKREADQLEAACADLKGTVESMESQNAEFTSFCSSVGAECADLKSQINELENALAGEEKAKAEREEAIARLTGEKTSGDEETARLSRDIRDLSQANNRLREDMESAEERSRRVQRDLKNIERRMGDIEEVIAREGRAKGDCEASNKHLADQLQQALEKIDTLAQQCNEADGVVKGKEREVSMAQERLRDEASRVLRLEQQLIELGSQVTQLGRPSRF